MPEILTTLKDRVHTAETLSAPDAVRILRCDAWRYRIPLQRPFGYAQGRIDVREGLVLQLTSASGATGIGEGVAHPFAPTAGVAEAWQEVCAWQRALRLGDDTAVPSPDRRGRDAVAGAFQSPLVRIAVETAACDLRARERGLPLAATLTTAPRASVPVNATVGTGDPEVVAAEVAARVARGFACVKLKFDPARIEEEVETLRLVRQSVGSGLRLRLDANAACTVDVAIAALRRIAEYDVEYVEQPVASIADMARVRRAAGVRIAADESVVSAESVKALAAAGAADAVVVKPALCGIAEAVRIADEAQRWGLEVVVTSALETSVGVAAALHVAAAVPGTLGACGLATAGLLSGDLVRSAPAIEGGTMYLPGVPGLGVELDSLAAARWAVEASEVEAPAGSALPEHGRAR